MRTQEGVDKKRQQLEDSIRKMQIAASRDSSGKGAGQVASRKKKLARHGAEKNEHGHRFRAQQDSTNGMSSMRAGSQNGEYIAIVIYLCIPVSIWREREYNGCVINVVL